MRTECQQQSLNSPTAMQSNIRHGNSPKHSLVENHPFYHCIRPLLWLAKISGGWIHRPLRSTDNKCRYYVFQIYCILWQLITIGALIRSVFIFDKDVSLDTENMLTVIQVSLLVTTGICQLASYFKYKKVLPFWDSLLQFYPQKFNCQLRRPKVFIWVMIIATICYASLSVGAGCYQFLKSDSGEAYIKLAEPWSENIKEARIAYMVSIAYFLPLYINWASARILLVVATYYLRWGFKDLHNTMASDTRLVNQIALHKRAHMRLSQMTGDLDDILWGYNGANIAMCTVDLCLVIYTLQNSKGVMEFGGSIMLLIMAVITMSIITVLSLSINAWVSWDKMQQGPFAKTD